MSRNCVLDHVRAVEFESGQDSDIIIGPMRSLLVGAATFGFDMVVGMDVCACFDRIKQPIMIQALEDMCCSTWVIRRIVCEYEALRWQSRCECLRTDRAF